MSDSNHSILESFTSISLEEMDDVKFLKRIDLKYVIPSHQLNEILSQIIQQYDILEIENRRISRYKTTYFDTSDLLFFKDHHNRLSRRLKVRYRSYLDSNLHFFEIKRKRNDVTKKYRQKFKDTPPSLTTEQLEKVVSYYQEFKPYYKEDTFNSLIPTLTNKYERITLISKDKTERCTIDLNLKFINPESPHLHQSFGELVIIEVKKSKSTITSGISAVLRDNKIRATSMSKYVTGIIHLYPEVKHNSFKPVMLHFEKVGGL